MSIANKLANENHDEIASMTSRGTSKHGVSKGVLREKRIRNRRAKREEEEIAYEDSEGDC